MNAPFVAALGLAFALGVLLLPAGPSPVEEATAYCLYTLEELGCSNPCLDAGRAYTLATGQPAPWNCPM